MTKTLLTLRYHWKAVLGWSLAALIGGIVWTVWASPERPYCSDWDERWYHHLTTVEHVRYCIQSGRVQINQVDARGRTLLHRIAVDIAGDNHEEYWEWDPESEYWRRRQEEDGNNRRTRTQIVKELLRWEELDIDALDNAGRTAWNYAIKKSNGWALAALLTEAGAAVQITERDEQKIQDTWLPVLRFAEKHLPSPLKGQIELEDLAACQTVECLVGGVLPDVEVQRQPEVQQQLEVPQEPHPPESMNEEGVVRMLPYRPAWGLTGTPEE